MGPGQNLQEGGFAFPIPTHQPDVFPRLDLKVRIVKEGAVTKEDPEVLATDQGHDGSFLRDAFLKPPVPVRRRGLQRVRKTEP
jgi:hypothetical protein